ncbi:response regulator transcription factor [Paenibacillus sepulcri]|uniref:Response regulator transcription factor n=2 Tax=Paenibacillus sepulcri TaxID=359917 RepID=A0ABS7C0I7_9BACL|nr:response regulator transcription factor [Paenibacillus sepulcri]
MTRIRTFICEDDELFCQMLTDYINRESDMEVIGTTSHKQQLLNEVRNSSMDVLLLDLNLTEKNFDGIEAAIEIKAMQPGLQIIVLSSFDSEEVMTHALAYARVNNYITKEHFRDIPDAIRAAYTGRPNLHYSSAGKLLNRFIVSRHDELKQMLTPVQIDILRKLDQGYSRNEVAEALFYTRQSINNELYKAQKIIKGKFPYLEWLRLKKHNTRHLIELSKQLGLLEQDKRN